MSDEPISTPVIQSYVHHKDKSFFVSTIERRSSTMESPDVRYNETLVWNWDPVSRERGDLIHQAAEPQGVITRHLLILNALHAFGVP